MFKKILFLGVIVVFSRCDSPPATSDEKDFDYQKIKSTAEDSTRNFNPGFVQSFHRARVYTIRDFQMYDSLVVIRTQTMPVIKTVAGDVPGRDSKGDFEVIFLVEQDTVLKRSADSGASHRADTVYKYRMDSPLHFRREIGADRGLYKVKAGSFLVPLPPVRNITKIVLKDNDGTELVSTFR